MTFLKDLRRWRNLLRFTFSRIISTKNATKYAILYCVLFLARKLVFVPENNFNYIKSRQNTTENQFLGVVNGEVKLVDDPRGHAWEKGEANKQGYFTFTNPASQKALTTDSEGCLKIEGKDSRKIQLFCCIFVYLQILLYPTNRSKHTWPLGIVRAYDLES